MWQRRTWFIGGLVFMTLVRALLAAVAAALSLTWFASS